MRRSNLSNCCCVMGGRTALRGLWDEVECVGRWGCDTSEFVIDAIRCKGDNDDDTSMAALAALMAAAMSSAADVGGKMGDWIGLLPKGDSGEA